MSEKYKSLKVKELQELLQKASLPHTGKKEELVERLVKHDETKALELASLEAEFGNLEDFDETKLNLDELGDHELKSFQPENKERPIESVAVVNANTNTSATTTTTATSSASDKSTTLSEGPVTKAGSGFKFNPIVFDKTPAATAKDKAMTEAERKLERAKRFGGQVDEKTKQEIRAARFGTGKPAPATSPKPQLSPTKKPSPASKSIDPEVLKNRAERFGLPEKTTKSPKTTTALSAEEEEKKRKRAERFGVDANKKTKN